MSSAPTAGRLLSIPAIFSAMRSASVSPRFLMPTRARSAPPACSTISWAMRVSARSRPAWSSTCASFAETCPKCAAVVVHGAAFCGACGVAFNVAPAERFSSPGSYTPPHLAERILTSRAALEGERKQVTVLFADLKGSMELLADRDPEDARHILDRVLEQMMEAVHRYEGTV